MAITFCDTHIAMALTYFKETNYINATFSWSLKTLEEYVFISEALYGPALWRNCFNQDSLTALVAIHNRSL